jgi:AraC-like DNA-binding protein
VPIRNIDDLADSVLDAGHEAIQLSPAPVRGSLIFDRQAGVTYSSGRIDGRVGLRGAQSADQVLLGVGLRIPEGCRHWLQERRTGDVCVFLPGDEQDAVYPPGSVYLGAVLSMDDVEARAADLDLVLDRRTLGGTGFHPRRLPTEVRSALYASIRSALDGDHAGGPLPPDRTGPAALDAILRHLARPPRSFPGRSTLKGQARIVARALEYIRANLGRPLTIEELAGAAHTSRRTLHRAFRTVLDETPREFVRTLRLHRIRDDLARDDEKSASVSRISHRWGIPQQSRMAARYRSLFGELPSETLARRGAPDARGRVAPYVRAKLDRRQ